MTPVVSPNVKRPGLYLKVTLNGLPSNGAGEVRGLLLAPKGSAGTITPNTQLVRRVAGASAVATLLGQGTPGHLAAIAFFRAHTLGVLDVAAPVASAGATAAGTFTLSGTPVESTVIRVRIHDFVLDIPWAIGVTPSAEAAIVNAELVKRAGQIAVTPTVSGAVITATAKIAGAWGNDILIGAQTLEGDGVITPSGSALTGGTLEPDYTTILALVAPYEYSLIIPALSNADACSAGSTSNGTRIRTHVVSRSSGHGAKLEQVVIGATASLGSAKVGAIGRNEPRIEYVYLRSAQSLPCQIAGWEAGRRLWLRDRKVIIGNRTSESWKDSGIVGAVDIPAARMSDIEFEDALTSGLSVVDYDGLDQLYLARPITTYCRDANDAFDSDVYGVEAVDGTDAFARALRIQLPEEFRDPDGLGVNIIPDLPEGVEEVPPNTVEVRDVRATVLSIAEDFVRAGVLRRDKLDEAINEGSFIVKINDDDPEQVDIEAPVWIVRILSKLGVHVIRRG